MVRVACPEKFALWTFGQFAPIGLTFAAAHPERLTHLLVHEGEARSGDWERAVPALGQTYRLLSELDWHVYSETTARIILGIEDPESARSLAAFLRAAIDQPAFLELSKARDQWDATDILSNITVPTLVAHDTNVLWMPSSVVQRVAAGIPGARFVSRPGLSSEGMQAIAEDFILGKVLSPNAPSPPAAFRTVLFTDLVGHTEMMSRLGDDAGRAVLREHERITREVLKANGGTEVKTMGDGFMASFGSVTKAVECAIALQRAFADREGEPLSVRVGLNAGEPIEEDGDLFGATVILASRIAAKAEGGEILVADTVRGLCSGKGFLFSDRGEFVAKGFEEPVRVCEVNWRE